MMSVRTFRYGLSLAGKYYRSVSSANVSVVKTERSETRKPLIPSKYRYIYPEFLPDPEVGRRNFLREKLERQDMLSRRTHIDIPEFYVGSILAVTSSNPHSQGKSSRFLGICISRDRCGLRARFILRNVIDHQGVEVLYEMYDPKIEKIEVIRLEKRLDEQLFYLRDAYLEYSTFDVNMEPEIIAEGASVPINEIKVKLKPRPWLERYERQNLKGVQELKLAEKFFKRAAELATPWEKFDLMKEYRYVYKIIYVTFGKFIFIYSRTIPEEEQSEIYTEIYSQLHDLELKRKKMKRKRTFIKPIKLA